MRIRSLAIRNFRCFSAQQFRFDAQLIVVDGPNGSGKSSLLEALHYACYFQSFRTAQARDLILHTDTHFFIKMAIEKEGTSLDVLEVGFSGNQRLVKLNGQKVTSYKQLLDTYRVITITEDDLLLIQGSPEQRRAFIDAACTLKDPNHALLLRDYKKIVSQRNALLAGYVINNDLYRAWTEQLWKASCVLADKRQRLLAGLAEEVTALWQQFFLPGTGITLAYTPKKYCLEQSWQEFFAQTGPLFGQELRLKRSCFGAHLDDFSILFKGFSAQKYASRGQQKLLVILLKIAQYRLLGSPALFLLDDFLTDLDQKTVAILLELLANLGAQVFLASPHQSAEISALVEPYGPLFVTMGKETA
jgi:DNA replication and repair protein RecF